MNLEKILIDTNIIIHLEDNKEISENYANFTRICSQYGIQIFIHSSSYTDISNDKNVERKKISLSKLAKYPQIEKTPQTKENKEKAFGPIKNSNDDVDTDMLVSLELETVDILVTEDAALKSRAKQIPNLSAKIFNISEIIEILNNKFGSIAINYQHVQDKKCNQLHYDLPFFVSLRNDYPEFID